MVILSFYAERGIKMDKSLFFTTISLICIWLILDNIYGKKYINKFLNSLFPFVNLDDGTTKEENKPGDVIRDGIMMNPNKNIPGGSLNA